MDSSPYRAIDKYRIPGHRHPRAHWRHHGVWRDVVLIERRSPAVT
jgi:hypothetical protein